MTKCDTALQVLGWEQWESCDTRSEFWHLTSHMGVKKSRQEIEKNAKNEGEIRRRTYAIERIAAQRNKVQRNITQCDTAQQSAALNNAVKCSAAQRSKVQR